MQGKYRTGARQVQDRCTVWRAEGSLMSAEWNMGQWQCLVWIWGAGLEEGELYRETRGLDTGSSVFPKEKFPERGSVTPWLSLVSGAVAPQGFGHLSHLMGSGR